MNQIPKLLLVDDVPTNIQVLAEFLGDEYELYFATNGLQALDIAAREHPDLVLLDVRMPGMDGFGVAEAMKADPALKLIPLIFVTASDCKDDEVRGLRLGGADFITKPFNPMLVALRVANHIDLKRQRDLLADQSVLLQHALDQVKTLSGLLPMCAWCRKVRDENGYWKPIEVYLRERTDASISHGICPPCRQKMADELYTDQEGTLGD
ncbi:MAG: response regulator [Acidobacteriota bacterium]